MLAGAFGIKMRYPYGWQWKYGQVGERLLP